MQQDSMDTWIYFSSPVYNVKKPEFLKAATDTAKEYLNAKRKIQKLNEIYPMYDSDSFHNDTRVSNLVDYVLNTSWNILDSQGYDVSMYRTVMHDFWAQEHHKHSGHDRHIHGSIISGFYFLECPTNSCKFMIHEPRPSNEYIMIPEKNPNDVTYATKLINFVPEPGTIIFTNSWLPHSFTRNESNKPFRFIHFNIGVEYIGQQTATII
jgi:uncharacterized protein (TIGR02466 family)